jgi:hypothetical protein
MPTARLLFPLLLTASANVAAAQPHVDLQSITRHGTTFVADLEEGGAAELTLNAGLQDEVEEVLSHYEVPFGAAVAISIPDGRVLALAGRSAVDPSLGAAELALRPWAPAASVFKIVAASALVGEASLSGASRTCYHGGIHAVLPENLLDLPRLDRRCGTLAYGLGKSQNAIIAKLAARHLQPAALLRVASSLGFGAPIAFDAEVEPSEIEVPEDPLEFARTAAGFWHSSLSPLHGALMAAAVANAGEMPAPRLIERAAGADGRPLALSRRPARRALAPEVAREVGQDDGADHHHGHRPHRLPGPEGPPLPPRRGGGQDRDALLPGPAPGPRPPSRRGARRRLPGLQLVRRLCARPPAPHRLRRRHRQPPRLEDQGHLRRAPDRGRVSGRARSSQSGRRAVASAAACARPPD